MPLVYLVHSRRAVVFGPLFAWGSNGNGALGDGTAIDRSSPVSIGTLSWTAISANAHTLAIRSDGALFAWGLNSSGQLGLNDQINRSSPVQIGSSSWSAVATGAFANAAIRIDGALFTWGFGGSGIIGDGVVVSRSSPVQIGSSSWTAVAVGRNHMAAIRADDSFLYTWGNNANGQLGNGASGATNRSSPTLVAGPQSTWTKVTAGANYTLAIRSDSTLWSWGINNHGVLGHNSDPALGARSSPVQVGALSWRTVSASDPEGDNPPTLAGHVLAIRNDGTLWAWGFNSVGQLGKNDLVSRSSPVQVGALTTWTRANAGQIHSMALRSDGALFTWGANLNGPLGQNDQINRSSPVQVGASSWIAISAGNVFSHAIRT